ncbi:MAG: Ig-like domain-containing protein [Evtepia sp.]
MLFIIPLIVLIVVIVLLVRSCGTPEEKTSYKIELSSQTMVVGQTGHASLVGLPKEKADSVVWSSSDVSIVSVKGSGALKAEKEGSATIGARIDGVTSSATVVVVKTAPGVTAVTLDQAAVSVASGETLQLAATVSMEENQPTAKVFWISDDESVALVSDDGLITARDVGETVIKAMAGTQTALCRVSVVESAAKTEAVTPPPVTTPTSDKTNPDKKPTATTNQPPEQEKPVQQKPTTEKPVTQKPTTKPSESTNKPAESTNKPAESTNKPAEQPAAPTKVTVSSSFGYLSVGETMALEAAASNNSAVTWGTSDASLATVSGGVVTAKGVGTVTITATSDGQSASCTISITADEEPAP